MADVVGHAVVEVTTDASRVGTGAASAGKSAGTKFRSSFSGALKGLVGAVGIAAAGAAVTKVIGDSISEAREAQKVGALTTAVIKSTGGAANVTAKAVSDLANSISLKTGIDDESIQAGQNMLLTFKNIRNEAGAGNDIFNQTTQTLVDLSAAMGKDAKSSAIQLGKALNDPVKGITALTRVGVTFNDQQQKTIANFVKQGKTAEAQKIILKELNSEFGGAAKSQATAADKATVAWKNLEEQLGTLLLPLLDRVENLIAQKVVPAISKFVKQMQRGKGAGGDFRDVLDNLWGIAKDLWPAVQQVFKQVSKLVGFMASHQKVLEAFVATLLLLKGFKVAKGALGGVTSVGSSLGGAVASKAGPVPVFVTNPGFAGGKGPGGVLGGGKTGGGLLSPKFLAGFFATAGVAIAGDAFLRKEFGEPAGKLFGKEFGDAFGKSVSAVTRGFVGLPDPSNAIKTWKHVPELLDDAADGWHHVFDSSQDATTGMQRYAFNAGIATKSVSTHLDSTATHFDDATARAGKASAAIDLIGPHAQATSSKAVAAIHGVASELDTIHDKRFNIIANTTAALLNLARIRDTITDIHGKTVTIVVRHTGGRDVIAGTTATGGIFTRPEVRLIGEAGPEAVVPLRRGAPMRADLAAALGGGIGGTTVTQNITLPTGDPQAAAMAVLNRLVAAG